jgi:hypothetical protein
MAGREEGVLRRTVATRLLAYLALIHQQ